MIELNKDKIQFKYLVGLNRTQEGYPTPFDILYDCCNETLDDTFFSEAKIENKYGLDEDGIRNVYAELERQGYIEKKLKNYRIVNTPWSW